MENVKSKSLTRRKYGEVGVRRQERFVALLVCGTAYHCQGRVIHWFHWCHFQGNVAMNDCSQWVLDFIIALRCSSVLLWRGQRFVPLLLHPLVPCPDNPCAVAISVGV